MNRLPIYTISSKRLFDRCPAAFEYRMLKELDSLKLSEPLERGIAFHEDAETAHSPVVEDRLEKGMDMPQGYIRWVRTVEDLTPIKTEFVIEISLNRLKAFIGSSYSTIKTDQGSFAGVVDLLAKQKDGTLWLVDHKSTINFYQFPYLYATEQLYMYYLALLLDGEYTLDGTCLSRVKVMKDVPYPKARNYIVGRLKRTLSKDITATLLSRWLKSSRLTTRPERDTISTSFKSFLSTSLKDVKGFLRIRPPVGGNVKESTLKSSLRTGKRIRLQLNVKTKNKTGGTILGLTIRNEKGYITSSIRYVRGTLVHVERSYHTPSPEELQQVAKDFLSYVETSQKTKMFRRAPGLHCSQCPFQKVCETERRMTAEAPRMTQDELLALDPALGRVSPSPEVERAKNKGISIKPPAILQQVDGVGLTGGGDVSTIISREEGGESDG